MMNNTKLNGLISKLSSCYLSSHEEIKNMLNKYNKNIFYVKVGGI